MPPADILCLWAKPRWRSILREEVFGARKTLKRLDHMNPSISIDEMAEYQATYNKRWPNQSFLSVNVFTLVVIFFFAIRLYNRNDSHHLDKSDLCSRLSGQSVARDCQSRFWSKQCTFALVAKARQHFVNLRNPNHLFPKAIIDCLPEAKSFLQIDCANESSFAKTIQLFKKPDARKWDFRNELG